MTFLNRQNVLKRWKVLWSDQFNYVLLFFIELQSCMSRYTGFEYNTTIILSIYWLFLEKTVNDVILFLSTSISRENLNVSKIPVINFFSFVYSYETSLGKYIYIYYMKQLRKLTCCFLTIFFKTPVSSCFSKTSLIDTKYWTFVGTFENILKKNQSK